MTNASSPRRYPLEALAQAHGSSLAELGRTLKVSGSTWKDVRDRGVTERAAYRYAERLGLHVYEVWPHMVDDHIDDQMADCANERCAGRFIPSRKSHRFCSQRCARATYTRERSRRLYAADAEFRSRKLEQVRQYRADIGPEAIAAAERRRYWSRKAS